MLIGSSLWSGILDRRLRGDSNVGIVEMGLMKDCCARVRVLESQNGGLRTLSHFYFAMAEFKIQKKSSDR
jgi:hypothetical protein